MKVTEKFKRDFIKCKSILKELSSTEKSIHLKKKDIFKATDFELRTVVIAIYHIVNGHEIPLKKQNLALLERSKKLKYMYENIKSNPNLKHMLSSRANQVDFLTSIVSVLPLLLHRIFKSN